MLAAAAIVVLVLLQHGKGADMGAAFGSGSAGSLFGSSGAANFLSRSTAVLAAVFFVTSLALTYLSASPSKSGGVTQTLDATREEVRTQTGSARSLGAGTVGGSREVHGDPEVSLAVPAATRMRSWWNW